MILPSSVFHLLRRPPPDRGVLARDLYAPGKPGSASPLGNGRPARALPVSGIPASRLPSAHASQSTGGGSTDRRRGRCREVARAGVCLPHHFAAGRSPLAQPGLPFFNSSSIVGIRLFWSADKAAIASRRRRISSSLARFASFASPTVETL